MIREKEKPLTLPAVARWAAVLSFCVGPCVTAVVWATRADSRTLAVENAIRDDQKAREQILAQTERTLAEHRARLEGHEKVLADMDKRLAVIVTILERMEKRGGSQ